MILVNLLPRRISAETIFGANAREGTSCTRGAVKSEVHVCVSAVAWWMPKLGSWSAEGGHAMDELCWDLIRESEFGRGEYACPGQCAIVDRTWNLARLVPVVSAETPKP